MRNTDLLRFLSDEEKTLIERAENVSPEVAESFLDEAEELLALRHEVAKRSTDIETVQEAA